MLRADIVVCNPGDSKTLLLYEFKSARNIRRHVGLDYVWLDKKAEQPFRQTVTKEEKRMKKAKISSPPGAFLASVADFFFSTKSRTLALDPILADMQLEYFVALSAGRKWKARTIRVCGCASFWKAAGLWIFLRTLGAIWGAIWKMSG
jgi:hypothetical protein